MRARIWILAVVVALCFGCETLSLAPSSPISALEVKATQGDADAQLALGLAYKAGDGVEANEALAVEWIEKSANQGVPEAESLMGFAYQNGEGVEQTLPHSCYG